MQEWVSIIVTHSTDPHAAVRAVMDPASSLRPVADPDCRRGAWQLPTARDDIIRIRDGWPTAPDILAAYRHVAPLT